MLGDSPWFSFFFKLMFFQFDPSLFDLIGDWIFFFIIFLYIGFFTNSKNDLSYFRFFYLLFFIKFSFF
jgi:hypothetical protein